MYECTNYFVFIDSKNTHYEQYNPRYGLSAMSMLTD